MKKPTNIDDYIASFPLDVRERLEQMRATVRNAAPQAVEAVGYGMPAFKLNGPLVYFGAFKAHIGFYATPTGHDEFKDDLARYKSGKGSVQFPNDEPLPLELITRIVKFRVTQNIDRAASKKKKGKDYPMAYNQQLADRVREIIARTHADVEEKRMFGGLCFMVNDKMCVGVESERMMVRFDPARNDEIMEMNGVGPMDFTKRVMKGFAFVDIEVLGSEKELEYWVGIALEFNKIAKQSKKRKD